MRLQHYIGNNDVLIQNAKGLKILLDNDSETWKNRKEGESLVIVLHGCNLANDEDGTPLAQRISESLIFKDMIIIAPNEELLFKTDGEYIGVYDKNNDMGDWLVYKNGKLVKKIPGDQMPTDDNIQDAQTHNNQNNNRHAWKDMTSILQSWMSQNPNIKWTIIY